MIKIIEITTVGQSEVEVTPSENSMSVEVINTQALYEIEIGAGGGGDAYLGGINQHFTGVNFFDNDLRVSGSLVVYPGATYLTGTSIYEEGSFFSASPIFWLANLPEYASNALARADGKPTGFVYHTGNNLKWVMPDGFTEPETGNPYFEKTLPSVFSQIIPSSEHGLTKIRGVTVLTPDRAEMEVYTEIRADQEVYIEALTNLNNHILILF